MDISKIDSVKAASLGAVMKLMHPTENTVLTNDDGTPMTITLLGTDSDVYRKAQRLAINRRMKSRKPATAEDIDSDALDLLSVSTVDWKITLAGSMPACSTEAARDLYATVPWIKEQVDTFINDRSNFLKASGTN